MRYPPRLGHLATRAVIAAKLRPSYAAAHHVDDDEAQARLERALQSKLWDDLLEATWRALLGSTKRLDEAALLEKIAQALQDRPLRPGRTKEAGPAWSAFFILADLEAGTASDAARKLLDAPQGRAMAARGLEEAGAFLAGELTRK